MLVKNHILSLLNAFVVTNDYEVVPNVDYSNFGDFHYQTSLGLQLIKKYPGFDPQSIIDYLKPEFESEITGKGFISIKTKLKANTETKYPKTILVDYCGVNVAKEMHIGHIRSMFIGDFIVRTHKENNDNVIIQNHVGDFGNQFGYLIAYLLWYGEKPMTNKYLTECYKTAYKMYTDDVEINGMKFKEWSNKIAALLQSGNSSNNDLGIQRIEQIYSNIKQVSLTEAYKMFDRLGLHLNASHTQGESFYAPQCNTLIRDLINLGIADFNEDDHWCKIIQWLHDVAEIK